MALRSWLSVLAVVASQLAAQEAQASGVPYLHDGVFFKGGVAVGPLWTRYDATANTPSHQRGTVTGRAGAFELSLGGAPLPGLVLAATGVGLNHLDEHWGNASVTQGWDSVSNSLMMFGPLVRYYPDPRGGFHADALLAVAFHRVTSERRVTTWSKPYLCPLVLPACADVESHVTLVREETTGVGAGLGAGYDFWVARQWSLGLTLRVDYAHTWGRAGTYDDLAPTLGFAVVFQ